jgi:hypothetical protein
VKEAHGTVEGTQEGEDDATQQGQRPVGTLVIYCAKWVPVARYVELIAQKIRELGVIVEVVDVAAERTEADQLGVVVLPTFIFWDEEGPQSRTGAQSLADVAALCAVKAPGRHHKPPER